MNIINMLTNEEFFLELKDYLLFGLYEIKKENFFMKNLLYIKQEVSLKSKDISFDNIYTSFYYDKVYSKKYSNDVLLSKLMDNFNSYENDMNEDNLEKLYKNLKLYIEELDGINI